MSDFEETHLSSVHARMASHVGEGPPEPVDDLDRVPVTGDPPVPGAQWDEVHRRWERWDEGTEAWVVAGDDAGDGVATLEENPLTAALARDLLRADDVEAAHPADPDVDRLGPRGPAPKGAQWNEVADRWERWDEAASAWIEALADPPEDTDS